MKKIRKKFNRFMEKSWMVVNEIRCLPILISCVFVQSFPFLAKPVWVKIIAKLPEFVERVPPIEKVSLFLQFLFYFYHFHFLLLKIFIFLSLYLIKWIEFQWVWLEKYLFLSYFLKFFFRLLYQKQNKIINVASDLFNLVFELNYNSPLMLIEIWSLFTFWI